MTKEALIAKLEGDERNLPDRLEAGVAAGNVSKADLTELLDQRLYDPARNLRRDGEPMETAFVRAFIGPTPRDIIGARIFQLAQQLVGQPDHRQLDTMRKLDESIEALKKGRVALRPSPPPMRQRHGSGTSMRS